MFGNRFNSDELAANFQKNIVKLKESNEKNYEKITKQAKDMSKDDSAESFIMDDLEGHSSDRYSESLADDISELGGGTCNMCGDSYSDDHECAPKKKKKSKKNMASSPSQDTYDSGNSYQASDSHGDHHKGASYVISNLNKIAKNLHKKGKTKAAKAVIKTAESIRQDVIAENQRVETIASLISNKEAYVISELNKIASDLRMSGNGHAADLVSITNNNIRGDAYIRASGKHSVISGLVKMAKEASRSGDSMSVDVIKETIEDIIQDV